MKNRGGRPRTTAVEVGSKVMMSMRVPPKMRRQLEKAIAVNGRSLTQEMEFRIERTFRDDELLAELREIRAMLDGGGR